MATLDAPSHLDTASLLLHPKRLRDPSHLQFIATRPCLICGRIPSTAHHLTPMKPRAMGKKVSDVWTVPLCFLHHRALHDVGNEERWWQQHQLDPKGEAEKLWAQSHLKPEPLLLVNPKPGEQLVPIKSGAN